MWMLIISERIKWKNDDKRIHLGGIIVLNGEAIKLINHNYFTGQKILFFLLMEWDGNAHFFRVNLIIILWLLESWQLIIKMKKESQSAIKYPSQVNHIDEEFQ